MPIKTVAVSSDPAGQIARPRWFQRLPRDIWILGLVSMFMDISSELVHSLMPVFLATVLGASMVTIGLIEGIAEATAAVTKVFSGTLSDYFRRRKWLVLMGYGLSAFTKPLFPLATSVGWIFAARFTDRIGKGMRGAPRDALIADIVPQSLRGTAYGFRQAFDSAGALLGPVLALLFMYILAGNIKAVLWIAVVPAMIAVVLVVLVREPEPIEGNEGGVRLRWQDAAGLGGRFWMVVSLAAVFTLARFSEAFLILRAQNVGLAIAYVPLILIVMNLVYAGLAYPAGVAADRWPARGLLVSGMLALVAADLLLAFATTPVMAFAGAAMWGLHMAMTQGLLSKLVADAAPQALRGTAFGIYNLATGVALLLASVLAGLGWSHLGAAYPFFAGAVFALFAVFGLLFIRTGTGKSTSTRGT